MNARGVVLPDDGGSRQADEDEQRESEVDPIANHTGDVIEISP
jgi:hypothetical protein